MTPSRQDFDPEPGAESIGVLLTRIRLASGRSQLRVAELLCAASGVPTLTRHEISRWEREERIPSPRWLRWLAVVLDVPLDDLEHAAGVARQRRGDVPAGPEIPQPPPGWLSAPPTDREPGAIELASRVTTLRRMDDLVGGADLWGPTGRELTAALRRLRSAELTERQRRRLLPTVAELAQLACWVAADAGAPALVRRAHRVGVKAATAAGAYPMLGHLLATLAHLDADPVAALELARRGYRLARPTASATARALLLHRVAFAAARAGQRRVCEQALAGAERAFDRRDPERDPAWLYWFNDAELTAMTGRCYAVLGRPRVAEPLLRAALADRRIRLRAWALYSGWLAAAQLDTGEVERASATVGPALLMTIRVGSVRALRRLTALHPRLRELRAVPAVRDYADLYRAALPYLPKATGGAAGTSAVCR
ncbi:MAG TPA: helix-turn-helix transcriptional regulator [Planosporangium sp.]|jgi:transcriptional regulator with XRE-family HTH domain|nr:helix-turn-helix transcriptional regulator [Planosporangium sp.]